MIKRLICVGLLAVVSGLTLANEVKLHVDPPTVKPLKTAERRLGFDLSAGLYFPQDSLVRSTFGKTGYMLAVEYGLATLMFQSMMVEPTIEAGWSRVGHSSDNEFTSYWTMLVARAYFNGQMSQSDFAVYFLAGIGMYFHEMRFPGSTERATRAGAIAGLGLRLAMQIYLEGGYRWSGKISGDPSDGTFLRARFRF